MPILYTKYHFESHWDDGGLLWTRWKKRQPKLDGCLLSAACGCATAGFAFLARFMPTF